MTISGFVENFSLPEIFQLIEFGEKSGRLKFNCHKNVKKDLKGNFELWFDRGHFVGIINSLKYQSLITKIQQKGWLDTKSLVLNQCLLPDNQALGSYLHGKNLLSSSQLDLLFEMQIEQSIKLFDVKHAWFKFDEIENNDLQITQCGSKFPWAEMTGQQRKAIEISLEAMRNISDYSAFEEEIPPDNLGLQRLVETCNLHFSTLEKSLCDAADGSISLKKIAQQMRTSVEEVQQTALSMILVGLVEQVPVTNIPVASFADKNSRSEEQSNISYSENTVANKKIKVSNSLVGNLVNFLRNNF